ncbi:hypothetical protein QBC39DRAFT_404403, partial [Podospora conica]
HRASWSDFQTTTQSPTEGRGSPEYKYHTSAVSRLPDFSLPSTTQPHQHTTTPTHNHTDTQPHQHTTTSASSSSIMSSTQVFSSEGIAIHRSTSKKTHTGYIPDEGTTENTYDQIDIWANGRIKPIIRVSMGEEEQTGRIDVYPQDGLKWEMARGLNQEVKFPSDAIYASGRAVLWVSDGEITPSETGKTEKALVITIGRGDNTVAAIYIFLNPADPSKPNSIPEDPISSLALQVDGQWIVYEETYSSSRPPVEFKRSSTSMLPVKPAGTPTPSTLGRMAAKIKSLVHQKKAEVKAEDTDKGWRDEKAALKVAVKP